MLTTGTVGRAIALGFLFGVAASGCGGEDEQVAPVEVVKTKPKAPKVTFEDKVEKAQALANAGKHDEAIGAFLPLLAEQPENQEVWAEVLLQAGAVDDAGALLDQLSAAEAIGGQTLAHHTLRAELALLAQRPDDALAAARLIAEEDAGYSAALRALAAKAGAGFDRSRLDPTNPADALILAEDAEKADERKTLLDLASTLDHWRVNMALVPQYTSLLDDRRVGESATAVLEALTIKLENSDSLRAKFFATSLRLDAWADPEARNSLGSGARKAVVVDGAKLRVAKATEAAKLANANRLGGLVPDFLSVAVEAHVQVLEIDAALELAAEMDAARREAEDPACDETAVLVSKVARLAGDFELALSAGEQAFFGRVESAQRAGARAAAVEATKKAQADAAKTEADDSANADKASAPDDAPKEVAAPKADNGDVANAGPKPPPAKQPAASATEEDEDIGPVDPSFRRPAGAAEVWALAAAESCVSDDVEPALEALRAQDARIARALLAHCEGDFAALGAATVDGSSDWAWLVASRQSQLQVGTAGAVGSVSSAINARSSALLASSGWAYAPHVIEAHLEWERHGRLAGDQSAREQAMTALLSGSFADTPIDASSVGIQSEVAVRNLFANQASEAPPSGVPSEILNSADWLALTMGTSAPEGATSAAAHWAAARQELTAGNATGAAEAYERAFKASTAERQGIWSPVLASDFADGPDIEAELARVGPLHDARFVLHEWARHLDFKRMAARIGDNPTLGMAESERRALRIALARERVRTVLWLAGAADAPVEERKASDAAWSAAVGDCVLDYQAVESLSALRAFTGDASVFSFYLGSDAVELMLITPTNVVTRALPGSVVSDVAAYRSALETAAERGVSAGVLAGDRVRATVFDPVSEQLSGPRYFILAPSPLLMVPMQALPEQTRGLRFFADIRRVGASPLAGPLMSQGDEDAAASEYTVDLLGIDVLNQTPKVAVVGDEVARTMAAAGLSAPNELNSLTALMGGGRLKVLRGDEATTTAVSESLAKARYLHVTSLGEEQSAGFQLTDSAMPLGALRCGPVPAVLASLAAPARTEVQLVRAICLINSGTSSVVTSLWDVPVRARYPFIRATYAALGSEGAVGAAMVSGRKAVRDVELDDEVLGPAVWGGFLLIGLP